MASKDIVFPIFPSGCLVCFRALGPDGNFARHAMPQARDLEHTADRHFIVRDANGDMLGIFVEDSVACIVPLETVGPSNASN